MFGLLIFSFNTLKMALKDIFCVHKKLNNKSTQLYFQFRQICNFRSYIERFIQRRNYSQSCNSTAKNLQTLCINGSDIWMTLLIHPKPHIHVKNPLSGSIRTRLRMYKVLSLKLGCHLCKGSMVCNRRNKISKFLLAVCMNKFLHINWSK